MSKEANSNTQSDFSSNLLFVAFCIDGYMHMHILNPDHAVKLEKTRVGKGEPGVFYTANNFLEMRDKVRSGKYSVAQMEELGNVGLGSAAKGNEKDGSFCGGGEVTLFDQYKTHRTIRGNKNYPMESDETFWTFDVVNFDGSEKKIDLPDTYNGKEALSDAIRAALLLSDKTAPFAATGFIKFKNGVNPVARSNGIFPEDKKDVKDPTQVVFPIDEVVAGGHVASGYPKDYTHNGDSSRNESGDAKTIREAVDAGKLSQGDVGFVCQIEYARAIAITRIETVQPFSKL